MDIGNIGSQLQPNYFEIELLENNHNFYVAPYSDSFFRECLEKNSKSYFYYREDELIYALPEMAGLSCPKEFEEQNISTDQKPYIFAKIISNSFNSYFRGVGRDIYKLKYSSIWSFTITSEEPTSLGMLALVPKCEYSIHPLQRSEKVIFLMTLSKEYKPVFSENTGDYGKGGIDIRDWDIVGDRIIATRANIKKYLERSNSKANYDSIKERLNSKEAEFEFLQKTFKYLEKSIDDIGHLGVSFRSFSLLNLPNANFEQIQIKKPTQFYYNNNTTGGYVNVALEQLKPLSFDLFNGQNISICVFSPNSDSTICDRFVKQLRGELAKTFHLFSIDITSIPVGSDRREHLKHISQFDNKQFDLALVFLYQRDKNQIKAKSAYNRLKAKLISKQIPSQTVLVENSRQLNQYVLRNIALNIYAKLGGTPWSIEKEGGAVNEFVIGVGSTINEKKVRNIGFASVFDHYGSYVIGSCSPLCKIQDYRENLRQYLSSLLAEIVATRGIVKNSRIRLVFHLFKGASKKYEFAAIESCLEEFVDYELEYAIVNVSYGHPFKLFKNVKDQLDRGCYIKMSDFQSLLCMGGIGSKPLQIRLDHRSTYLDLFEINKQILYFSHLSHTSFKPSNNPVTTTYPQRLAKLTSDLLSINHWDVDMLQGMKEKLWFI